MTQTMEDRPTNVTSLAKAGGQDYEGFGMAWWARPLPMLKYLVTGRKTTAKHCQSTTLLSESLGT